MWLKCKCRLRKLSKFTLRGRVAGCLRDGIKSSVSHSLTSQSTAVRYVVISILSFVKQNFLTSLGKQMLIIPRLYLNLIQLRKTKVISQPSRKLKFTTEKDVSFFSTLAFCNSSTRFCNIFILFSFSFSCSSLEFISA